MTKTKTKTIEETTTMEDDLSATTDATDAIKTPDPTADASNSPGANKSILGDLTEAVPAYEDVATMSADDAVTAAAGAWTNVAMPLIANHDLEAMVDTIDRALEPLMQSPDPIQPTTIHGMVIQALLFSVFEAATIPSASTALFMAMRLAYQYERGVC